MGLKPFGITLLGSQIKRQKDENLKEHSLSLANKKVLTRTVKEYLSHFECIYVAN